jgi:hypothetical protein
MAHFFERPWGTPHRDLRPNAQAWLLGETAYVLTGLGRLSDSVEPRQIGLEMDVARKDWDNAARDGGSLCNTLQTLSWTKRITSPPSPEARHFPPNIGTKRS